jgi:hypothetical protein
MFVRNVSGFVGTSVFAACARSSRKSVAREARPRGAEDCRRRRVRHRLVAEGELEDHRHRDVPEPRRVDRPSVRSAHAARHDEQVGRVLRELRVTLDVERVRGGLRSPAAAGLSCAGAGTGRDGKGERQRHE